MVADEFFFIVCRDGAAECSDESIECPATADLATSWWALFAQTVAASASPQQAASFTAALPHHLDGRTIHVIVHVWPPATTPATRPSALLCLSRTKIDGSPPKPPADGPHAFQCAPGLCGAPNI